MISKKDTYIFLESVEKVDAIVPNKLIEIQQMHDLATSITATMNGECVQSSGSKQKMADAVNKCMDTIDEISAEVDRLRKRRKEVIQTIEQLYSPAEYKVLHMRYIQHKDLEEIADEFGRSYDWAKDTSKRAVEHVQAILNKYPQTPPNAPKCP